jgi:hypothetical protein
MSILGLHMHTWHLNQNSSENRELDKYRGGSVSFLHAKGSSLSKETRKDWDCVIILHNSVTSHTAPQIQQWCQWYGWEVLWYPTHRPSLAHSDFRFFGSLKCHLLGQKIVNDDFIVVVTIGYRCLTRNFLWRVLCMYVMHCFPAGTKCLSRGGDCVEK